MESIASSIGSESILDLGKVIKVFLLSWAVRIVEYGIQTILIVGDKAYVMEWIIKA